MNTVCTWWADSRGKVIVILSALWALSITVGGGPFAFWRPLVAVVATVAWDLIGAKIRWGNWYISLSSVVTGLLIGLIFDPTSPLIFLVAASLFAVVGKLIGSGKHAHLFNPAAFGIIVSSLLFHRPVAWWAVSWGYFPVVILVIGMGYVLLKLRRVFMPASFLIIYMLTNSLLSGFSGALRLTIDGTVLLFVLVMLPEPITSNNRGKWRYGWGVLVGGLVALLTIAGLSFGDPLLFALLVANGIGFFARDRNPK